uniref:Uracil phosphoribosyltransferase n=1 Tax=Polysiphonia infestans TaxID=2006978 RepID=A0A1Z1MEQ2_9FLOR|nr:uracil phosphoribosyltransferase [Polysiphonia infestans]ARW64463.1 uracil phosphoribosyltransferase [Polysiphonia infestans]
MQLRIYKISHPLIKLMLGRINTECISNIDREYCERYMGFLIIYEILRKSIILKRIYIGLLGGTKEIEITDNKTKNIILTNTSETYSMITEIKCIISNLEVIHLEYDNEIRIENYIKNNSTMNKSSCILILEKITKDYQIMNLLDYLISTENITQNQISIGNIFSKSEVLKKISKRYPELKIYTTQVE